MRFLSLSLFTLAVSSLAGVSAVCNGDVNDEGNLDYRPIGAIQGYSDLISGTPSSDALPLFWTQNNNPGDFATLTGKVGVLGVDQFCNDESDVATATPGTSATVQARTGYYLAMVSSPTEDVYDRFSAVNSKLGGSDRDIVDSKGNCIANNVHDLFTFSYTLNNHLYDNNGDAASPNSALPIFTGSTGSGKRWFTSGTAAQISAAYCGTSGTSVGWNDGGGETAAGYVFSDLHNSPQMWLGTGVSPGANTIGCTNGQHILCLQGKLTPTAPPTTPPPNVNGDPQFTGLQGQSFQVHGMPEEYFNLISSPDMQLNSRFAYLASGRCNYNNTDCWTHPGTYVDQLGFMFPGLAIKAVAGTHDDGMMVFVNEKRIMIGATDSIHSINGHHHGGNTNASHVTISYTQSDKLIVSADLFTVYATNSDMFFNFGVTLHSSSLLTSGAAKHHIKSSADQLKYPAFPLHGLLGQTWKNARYAHGAFFAGSVDDYMLLDSKLFSSKFVFNQYKH